MQKRGRRLKFTAVLAMVVLALTGFSTGRHGSSKSRHSSGGGGGGCSSSSQNHDSSSTSSGGSYSSGSTTSGSSDDYDDSYGDSTSTSSSGSSYNRRPNHRSTPSSSSTGKSTLEDGTAKLISCATKKKPYATVEVTNPNSRKATFWTSVTFKDDADIWITDEYAEVSVPAKGKATVRVNVGGSGLVDSVDHCEVDRLATAHS
ncbi:hypothetical protein [Streptomyces sp. NPDC058371]|uniref:hypothetical protein n=1 Tax=Streptomyces sp. NPDC058371 TaxID=3346463 RepID=UPI003658CA14